MSEHKTHKKEINWEGANWELKFFKIASKWDDDECWMEN